MDSLLSFLGSVNPGDVGAAALVAAAVWAIFTGRLIPRVSHEREISQWSSALLQMTEERDSWREAHRISETARTQGQEQIGDAVLEVGATTVQLLRSIKERAAHNDEGGGPG